MSSRILQKGKNRLTQGYSPRHKAVDLGRVHLTGEPVIAHSAGRVVFCQTGQRHAPGSRGNKSYGNCVKLDHGGGLYTLYAHLATVAVTLGEQVAQGQRLGTMGNTGNSTGTHLHFELRRGATHLDPTPYLDAPLPGSPPAVRFRVWNGAWSPEYTGGQTAGTEGQELSALQAWPTGGTLRYRVHLLGGGWLPWVTNNTDWAGIRGRAVDAVQMTLTGLPGRQVRYRVSPVANGGWYGWCTGTKDATGDGYAGVFGKPIDRIQLELTETG